MQGYIANLHFLATHLSCANFHFALYLTTIYHR